MAYDKYCGRGGVKVKGVCGAMAAQLLRRVSNLQTKTD